MGSGDRGDHPPVWDGSGRQHRECPWHRHRSPGPEGTGRLRQGLCHRHLFGHPVRYRNRGHDTRVGRGGSSDQQRRHQPRRAFGFRRVGQWERLHLGSGHRRYARQPGRAQRAGALGGGESRRPHRHSRRGRRRCHSVECGNRSDRQPLCAVGTTVEPRLSGRLVGGDRLFGRIRATVGSIRALVTSSVGRPSIARHCHRSERGNSHLKHQPGWPVRDFIGRGAGLVARPGADPLGLRDGPAGTAL